MLVHKYVSSLLPVLVGLWHLSTPFPRALQWNQASATHSGNLLNDTPFTGSFSSLLHFSIPKLLFPGTASQINEVACTWILILGLLLGKSKLGLCQNDLSPFLLSLNSDVLSTSYSGSCLRNGHTLIHKYHRTPKTWTPPQQKTKANKH